MKLIPISRVLLAALVLASCASKETTPDPKPDTGPAPRVVQPAEADLIEIQRLEDLRIGDDHLTKYLKSDRTIVRRRALRACGRIGWQELVGPIAACLGETDTETLIDALWALGQIGGPAVYAATEPLLKSDLPDVRAMAVDTISRTLDVSRLGVVEVAAQDKAARVRAEAAPALARLAGKADSDGDRTLVELETRIVSRLLTDPDTRVRWRTAYALARLNTESIEKELLAATLDAEPLVRAFATRALARIPTVPVEPFARSARDKDARVAWEGVAALAGRKVEGEEMELLVAALTEAASQGESVTIARAIVALAQNSRASKQTLKMAGKHRSPSVRGAVIEAMALQSEDGSFAAASEGLKSRDAQVRASAARAMITINSEEAEAALVGLYAGNDRTGQLAALDGISELKAANPDNAARWDALVRVALKVEDLSVRGTAVDLLDHRTEPEWTVVLSETWKASNAADMADVREMILAQFEARKAGETEARAGLTDEKESVRVQAAKTLRAATGETVATAPGTMSPIKATPWEAMPYQATLRLETSRGVIRIRLMSEVAPVHSWTVARLAREGFYDGKSWHRVVPNFVVQGGDPRGDGWGDAGFSLRDENSREEFVEGTVGMAKAGKDTGSCQIFITLAPTPHLDGNYTVLGRVVEGLDVARSLEIGDRIDKATMER